MVRTDTTKTPSETGGGKRDAEVQVWHIMLDIHRALFSRLSRALGQEFGITLAKFDVLAQLYRNPKGLTQGLLSRQLKVTGGNVTGLVRRLVIDGLIDREMSASDRRAFVVRLTEQGAAVYLAARDRHDELLRAWLRPIAPQDIGLLQNMLRRLSQPAVGEPA